LFADLGAGLTVGLIALPLAIGFGIASGVTPQQGLWTGIIASLVVALLGGSRFQVAGPTGAFVPVLFSVVAIYGYGGLALATMMAGVMLILLGALRMGKLLKFFPYPVVAGFTSGIAVIIFCGQLNEFLGLGLKMPGHVPQQIAALASNLHGINWQAFAIGALTLGLLYAWPLLTRRVPASIVAVGGGDSGRPLCRLVRRDDREPLRRHPSRLARIPFSHRNARSDARFDGTGFHHCRAGRD
jgi:SulP family sulfate permease